MSPEERAERIADDLADNVIVESQLTERIAQAITAAVEEERDACADAVEDYYDSGGHPDVNDAYERAADAIRSRANVSKSETEIDMTLCRVDAVDKTCAGCRWWGGPLDDGKRPCSLLSDQLGAMFDTRAIDKIDIYAPHAEEFGVFTAPDFGCSLWEGK